MQQVPIAQQRDRLAQMLASFPADNVVDFTANTTSGQPTLASVSSTLGLQLGMTVTGAGIPSATTIIGLSSSSPQVTLSNNATATADTVALVAENTGGSAEVHLYSAAYAGGLDPTPASFTEATFTGYSEQALGEGSGVYTTSSGGSECDFGDFSWVLNSVPATTNTTYGYWVDYLLNGTRVVAMWEDFPAPKPMAATGNAVVLSIPFTLPNPGAATYP
jgi:hypothetical protein